MDELEQLRAEMQARGEWDNDSEEMFQAYKNGYSISDAAKVADLPPVKQYDTSMDPEAWGPEISKTPKEQMKGPTGPYAEETPRISHKSRANAEDYRPTRVALSTSTGYGPGPNPRGFKEHRSIGSRVLEGFNEPSSPSIGKRVGQVFLEGPQDDGGGEEALRPYDDTTNYRGKVNQGVTPKWDYGVLNSEKPKEAKTLGTYASERAPLSLNTSNERTYPIVESQPRVEEGKGIKHQRYQMRDRLGEDMYDTRTGLDQPSIIRYDNAPLLEKEPRPTPRFKSYSSQKFAKTTPHIKHGSGQGRNKRYWDPLKINEETGKEGDWQYDREPGEGYGPGHGMGMAWGESTGDRSHNEAAYRMLEEGRKRAGLPELPTGSDKTFHADEAIKQSQEMADADMDKIQSIKRRIGDIWKSYKSNGLKDKINVFMEE